MACENCNRWQRMTAKRGYCRAKFVTQGSRAGWLITSKDDRCASVETKEAENAPRDR